MESASTVGLGGRGLVGYIAAAGATAAAFVVRLAIDSFLTVDLPFLVFFPAILATALWFGKGPALFCMVLSGLAVAWRWIPPTDSMAVTSTSDIQGLVLFAISGSLMAWMVDFSRRSRTSRQEADQAIRDVEERRRWQADAEEQMAELSRTVSVRTDELKEREALMQAVVETAVDAILIIDERGIVRSFNQAAERMFGYAAAEVVGNNVNRLMPSPYREEHDSYVAHYLTTGVKKIIGIGREITALRKDGSTFPMYLSVSEVRLAGRRLFTGFIRDLTEQKRLEQEFLRSQKMEAIGSLSSSIAHDFNNVLMGILGCSRVASAEREGVSLRESLDEIAAAANRGVALTRRLLAFSRRAPLELRPTSIDDVVRDNEAMLRQLLGEDIVLRIELASRNASMLADHGLIEQIVINLLVNARDAMPRGGEIVVATGVDAEQLVLEVKDTGCGIPLELRPRIFEPFFTTKAPEKGTGLGLSTVKRITEHLQGRIELESELGKGTAFRLAFPRCEPGPRPPVGALEAKPRAAGPKGRTVLLVEDDRLVRASLSRFLKGKDYTVLVAASPSEALGTARAHDSIDVLVTDMVLPEITGSELASRLRSSAPRMKVIYMSAHPAEVLIAQGHLREDAPCLEKPFEMEALESLLAQVLAGPNVARAEHFESKAVAELR